MYSVMRAMTKATMLAATLLLAGTQMSVAQPALTDLNPVGSNYSRALKINASGQSVGFAAFGSVYKAALWNAAGTLTLLDPLGTFGNDTGAYFINDSGQVAGRIGNGAGAFYWDSTSGMVNVGLLYFNGARDWNVFPAGISANGWVMGSSTYNGGDGWIYSRTWLYRNGAIEEITENGARFGGRLLLNDGKILGTSYVSYCAALWDNGAVSLLGTPYDGSEPVGVNSSGQILLQYSWADACVRETNGTMTPLRVYGEPYFDPGSGQTVNPRYYGAWDCRADGIDDSGRVYGRAKLAPVAPSSDPVDIIWVRNPDGTFNELTAPGYIMNSDAPLLFNNAGQVVASATPDYNQYAPFMWTVGDASYTSLPTLGGIRTMAWAMNQNGAIAGFGETTGGAEHALGWGLIIPSALDVSTPVVTARNKRTVTLTVNVTNSDTETAYNVTVTAASLGGVTTNSLVPLVFGTIKPGVTKKCTLQFKTVPSGDQTFTLDGTSSLGAITSTQTVTVP